MPYGLKPENVLCANTIASMPIANWLLPNVWLDPPNMKTTKIMCSSVSKSIPPNTIVDYYALLHLTVPFIPPNPIYHYDTGNKISRMCVYYITFVICHSILIVVQNF